MAKMIICSRCKTEKEHCAKGFCVSCYGKQRKEGWTPERHAADTANTVAWQNRAKEVNKVYLDKVMGLKCSRCGYDEYFEALCSHHLDPTVKEGKTDSLGRWLKLKPSNFILKIAKEDFVLLCANCHIIEHLKDENETEKRKTKPQIYGLGGNNATGSVQTVQP